MLCYQAQLGNWEGNTSVCSTTNQGKQCVANFPVDSHTVGTYYYSLCLSSGSMCFFVFAIFAIVAFDLCTVLTGAP